MKISSLPIFSLSSVSPRSKLKLSNKWHTVIRLTVRLWHKVQTKLLGQIKCIIGMSYCILYKTQPIDHDITCKHYLFPSNSWKRIAEGQIKSAYIRHYQNFYCHGIEKKARFLNHYNFQENGDHKFPTLYQSRPTNKDYFWFQERKKSPFIHTQTKLGWKRGEKSQLTIAVQCPDKPRQRTAQQQPNPIQTVETLFQEKKSSRGRKDGSGTTFWSQKTPKSHMPNYEAIKWWKTLNFFYPVPSTPYLVEAEVAAASPLLSCVSSRKWEAGEDGEQIRGHLFSRS
jgi:hypothetical protein